MSFCNNVKENYRVYCYGSFGKEFVGFVSGHNSEVVEELDNTKLLTIYNWCKMGPEEGLTSCLNSALRSLYWGGENNPDVSIRFCKTIPEESESSNCFNDLIHLASYYIEDSNTKNSFCKVLPEEKFSVCQNLINKNTSDNKEL